jgi:uncharacterized membrane protein
MRRMAIVMIMMGIHVINAMSIVMFILNSLQLLIAPCATWMFAKGPPITQPHINNEYPPDVYYDE